MNNVPPLILVGYTTLTNSISNTLISMSVTNREIEAWASKTKDSGHRTIAATTTEATNKMKNLLEVAKPRLDSAQRAHLEHASQEEQPQANENTTEELLALNNQYDNIFKEWSQAVEQWEQAKKGEPVAKDGLPARFGYVCRQHDFGAYY